MIKFPMGRKKFSTAPIIEELDRININELSPLLKTVGDQSSLFYHVPEALHGFEELVLKETSIPGIVYLSGRYKGYTLRSTVEIVDCSFSHPRYFFICSQTGLRITHLYANTSRVYLSRYELEASYRVQREHRGPYYLLSRARDLKKRAALCQREGYIGKARELESLGTKMEQQFYEEKIGYFQNRITEMGKRTGL
jgi:hypothetical protein